MRHGASIAVVVPAFREERLIGRTLSTIPDWVDAIYAVDDASPDGTWRALSELACPRLRAQRHPENLGVGAAIVTGYRAALAEGHDVLAVMAGDAQMHPGDLGAIVDPVALGKADYVKGNRFRHAERRKMPVARRLGGAMLSALTRAATGLDVGDTQCGYTALSARAARLLPLDELWPRYGYPNDLLGMLAAQGFCVAEAPVRPVYADEQSGVRPWHLLSITAIVTRRWLRTRAAPAQSRIARSTSSSA